MNFKQLNGVIRQTWSQDAERPDSYTTKKYIYTTKTTRPRDHGFSYSLLTVYSVNTQCNT